MPRLLAVWLAVTLFLAGCSGHLHTTTPASDPPVVLDDTFRISPALTTNPLTLSWEAPPEHVQYVGGYYLYYWQTGGETPTRVDVGKRTTYTLEPLDAGQLYTFGVTAHDGQGGKESVVSNKVQRWIPVTGFVFVVPAPGVLANDQMRGGGILKAELVNGSSYGRIDLEPDGGFTYTPHTTFRGTDSFTYRAVNDALASNPATVTLRVTSGNDAHRAAASIKASASSDR